MSEWLYFAFAQENLLCLDACILPLHKKTSLSEWLYFAQGNLLCLYGCILPLHKKTFTLDGALEDQVPSSVSVFVNEGAVACQRRRTVAAKLVGLH